MLTHGPLAKNVDQAIAGLLRDLKKRGMLDDTLVVWTTEFGRTPFNSAAEAKGREHHHWVFSSWLAGAGVKSGMTSRRIRRIWHSRREGPGPRSRFPCHYLASDGARPHAPDLPAYGSRLSTDRCPRPRGERAACVTIEACGSVRLVDRLNLSTSRRRPRCRCNTDASSSG